MSADIILFALIAAGLIFWLRNILGTRDEDEPQRPNLFLDEDDDKFKTNMQKNKDGDNVVSLNASLGDNYSLPRHVRIDNKTTENKLDDVARNYPGFDLGHFVDGAEFAFTMIVEAFAAGDIETLENLLAPEVYQAFTKAIEQRNERGEKIDTKIKDIEKIDIIEAHVKNNHIFITVRFSAREICVIRDKDDKILSGDPNKTTVMVDIWVFGRELEADGPEWYLYETRDDEIEDHKTPIPEGGSDN